MIKNRLFIVLTSVVLFNLCCMPPMAGQPLTRVYDGAKLAAVKAKKDTPLYEQAVKKLITEADKSLAATPPSVMQKKMVAVSGDKHDYISMGPYWWPDPSKPDGLPYIRKDGLRNPELDKLDRNRLGDMAKHVTTLGLAYYFSGEEKYARKAADFLNTWFLNPKTRMNPNLNYGQTIPGHNNGMGRGTGLIDTYSFVGMLDAVELLNGSKAMNAKLQTGLKDWFTEFTTWMQESKIGLEEKEAKNNHGLAYDVQLAAFALYIQNTEVADAVIKAFPEERLFRQIEPDGKQPLELERTTAFGYTIFNLWHMLDMSYIAKTRGIDIYNSNDGGRSITSAIGFILPYMGKPQSEWPWQQIKDWDKQQEEACWLLRRASFFDPQAGYEALAAKYMKTPQSSRYYLLYNLE